jgi:glycosyltransferase involved in cell wall biosynthesis
MKFSVLLPTRNRLDLLARAIETVRRQDYADWEIIVSDNFSEEDVAGYIKSLAEPRIKYVRTDRFLPVTENWNNALRQSSGDYVIMLGDDDGLMKGYFTESLRLINEFSSPDLIFTSAFLYAYPGVLPDAPAGYLRSFMNEKVFEGAKKPFWLTRDKALYYLNESLNFRAPFYYNMQFSLVSRKLIDAMKLYGDFYQSPYPDFYATNAMMLKAERILIAPKPMVAIGISPKSFGFYYYNDIEKEGNAFLNNAADKDMVERLQKIILPGTDMNTSWLVAMETLARNFALKVNYQRYRYIQIFAVYDGLRADTKVGKFWQKIKEKIRVSEWLRYGIILSIILKIVPERYRHFITYGIFFRVPGSHIGGVMPEIEGRYETMLDVFEKVKV